MRLVKLFSKDALIYGLGGVLKKSIALLLIPLYTRVLSPDQYGILDTINAGIIFFSTFLNLGLATASSRFFFKSKDAVQRGKILFATLTIRLLSLGLIIPLMIFHRSMSDWFFGAETNSLLVLIALTIIPAQLLSNEQENIYRLKRNPRGYLLFSISKAVLGFFLGMLLVVYLKKGISGALLSGALSAFTVLSFSFILYTRKHYCFELSTYWIKKIFFYGLPAISVGLATWVLTLSDRFFLLMFSNLESIGYYAIGNKFSEPLRIMNTAAQMSFGPLIVALYERDISVNKLKTRELADNIWSIYLYIAVFVATLLAIFGKEIISLVATESYTPGYLAMPWLVFSFVLMQSSLFVGYRLNLKEKRTPYFFLMASAAIFNLILNYLLIPAYGFVGAAIATWGAYLLNLLVFWFFAGQYFPPRQKIIKNLLIIHVFLILSLMVFNQNIIFKLSVILLMLILAYRELYNQKLLSFIKKI